MSPLFRDSVGVTLDCSVSVTEALFRLDVRIATRTSGRRNDRHPTTADWWNRNPWINSSGRTYHALGL